MEDITEEPVESEIDLAIKKINDKVMGLNKRLNVTEGKILELSAFESYDKYPYFKYIKTSIMDFRTKIDGID